jgi:peptide chain release factor subunit 1
MSDTTDTTDTTDVHDLRDRLDRIAAREGEGTELVTLTVPPDADLRSVRDRIADEHAGAANIRSDRTRERVRRALDRVQRELRGYAETPEHGLAAFAGVVDGDLEAHVLEEFPRPLPSSTYRCDDRFHVEPVRAAVEPGERFGLLVVERGGAAVGRLAGDRVVPIRSFDSRVMRSSRAGGQSAERFARERERQAHEFYEEVADVAREAFLGDDPVEGVVVGGTLSTARRFVDEGYLDHRLERRVLGTYGVEYATEQGLEGLVAAAGDDLLDAEHRRARDRLTEFFERLRDDDRVTYGADAIDRAVEYGAVDELLVADSVDRERRADLETAVDHQGGDTLVVSTETDRGERFARAFDGVGALLRFPVN